MDGEQVQIGCSGDVTDEEWSFVASYMAQCREDSEQRKYNGFDLSSNFLNGRSVNALFNKIILATRPSAHPLVPYMLRLINNAKSHRIYGPSL